MSMFSDHTTAIDHPSLVALLALVSALQHRTSLFESLCRSAHNAGVPYGSKRFDEAAEKAGLPYSRVLDLYCTRKMRDEAAIRPFAHMPRLTERC